MVPRSEGAIGTALGWSFAMNGVRLLSTLGTAFILASLLGPRAFGTVALALIFVTLVQLLIQQGLVPAIVQSSSLTWRMLDSAFWVTVGGSLVLALFAAAVAPWWAHINGTPEATEVIWALSGLIVIKGLVVVQEGVLQRQLQFKDLAIRTTVASAAGAVVGITAAVVWQTIWALVAQQLVGAVVGAVVIWGVTPWRPHRHLRLREVRGLLGFASKATLSSIGVFTSTRIDAVLIGVFFGAAAIGLYQLAYRVMQSAIETTVYPIAGVALADLSRHQRDAERLADRYSRLVGLAAAVGAPVMAIIFSCAGPLMATVGPEWEPAAPALQLLCVVGVVTAIGMVNSPALQAVGRPGAQAALVWFGAVVSATTFTAAGLALRSDGLEAQVVGMAGSRAVVYVAVLLPVSQFLLVARFVGVGPVRFLRVIAPPVLASVVAALVGLVVSAMLAATSIPHVVQLLAVGTATVVVVVPLILVASPSARIALERVRQRLALRRGVAPTPLD